MAEPVHFILDLDDTLYAEREYVRSAFTQVGELISTLFGVTNPAERIQSLWNEGMNDPIANVWAELRLPDSARSGVIAAMRAHIPSIMLRPDAARFLKRLRDAGAGYAIVTDGRSVTQRAKMAALGCLDARYVSISEEVGLAKTDTERFADVSRRLGPGRYIYIGDNPAKDFYAPNRLGWRTVMLSIQDGGIHPQGLPDDMDYRACFVINSFDDIDGAVADLPF